MSTHEAIAEKITHKHASAPVPYFLKNDITKALDAAHAAGRREAIVVLEKAKRGLPDTPEGHGGEDFIDGLIYEIGGDDDYARRDCTAHP